MELPTGDTDSLSGSGHTDMAVELSAAWTLERHRLLFGVGYSILGDFSLLPRLSPDETTSFAFAWEVLLAPRVWGLASLLHSSSPFTDIESSGIEEDAEIIAIGPRFELRPGIFLDFVFVENMLNVNADLDVGMILQLTYRP